MRCRFLLFGTGLTTSSKNNYNKPSFKPMWGSVSLV